MTNILPQPQALHTSGKVKHLTVTTFHLKISIIRPLQSQECEKGTGDTYASNGSSDRFQIQSREIQPQLANILTVTFKEEVQ